MVQSVFSGIDPRLTLNHSSFYYFRHQQVVWNSNLCTMSHWGMKHHCCIPTGQTERTASPIMNLSLETGTTLLPRHLHLLLYATLILVWDASFSATQQKTYHRNEIKKLFKYLNNHCLFQTKKKKTNITCTVFYIKQCLFVIVITANSTCSELCCGNLISYAF